MDNYPVTVANGVQFATNCSKWSMLVDRIAKIEGSDFLKSELFWLRRYKYNPIVNRKLIHQLLTLEYPKQALPHYRHNSTKY